MSTEIATPSAEPQNTDIVDNGESSRTEFDKQKTGILKKTKQAIAIASAALAVGVPAYPGTARAGGTPDETRVERVEQGFDVSPWVIGGKSLHLKNLHGIPPEDLTKILSTSDFPRWIKIYSNGNVVMITRHGSCGMGNINKPGLDNNFTRNIKNYAKGRGIKLNLKGENKEKAKAKIPKISFKKNPETEKDFQGLYNKLKRILTEWFSRNGVDEEKVKTEKAYIDYVKAMEFMKTSKFQEYMKTAGPHQLKNVEYQANDKIENLYAIQVGML